jgi:hypothetical protein
MPVFGYLSEEEAADAYLYLTLYPPQSLTMAAITSPTPVRPTRFSPPDDTRVPVSDDPEDPQPVSLARLAVFPGVIFLFLGSVALKGLPRIAAHALRGRANSQAASARISTRQFDESGKSRGRGERLGEVLPKAEGI